MARGDSLARQLQVWMLLDRERSLSVDEVCVRLSINRRTLYRDLDVLQRCGLPLYQEQMGRAVRWKLDDGFRRTVQVQLSVQEAMAIVAAERMLSSMDGTVFASAARSAVDKLRTLLAPPLRERLDRLATGFSATAGAGRDLTAHGPHLELLLNAVEAARVVRLTYRKLRARTAQQYTVEPHHLHVQASTVYLVAWVKERRAARIFLLDRVRSVELMMESFVRRPELPLGVFDQGAFGLWEGKPVVVRLRFSGTAARIVAEQRLHPSQRMSHRRGGVLALELTVPLSPSLVAWVRGFKGRVEVLAPPELRNEL